MCAPGGAKAWIESNKQTPLPSHMTPEVRLLDAHLHFSHSEPAIFLQDKEYYRRSLLGGGLTSPLCWYKVLVQKYNHEDDAS